MGGASRGSAGSSGDGSDGSARGVARHGGRLGDLLFGGFDQSQYGTRRGHGVPGLDGPYDGAVTRQRGLHRAGGLRTDEKTVLQRDLDSAAQ